MPPPNKIRLLIFSYYFPPASVAGAQRPFAFARYLDPDQYEVHVIRPSKQDAAYPETPLEVLSYSHIQIHNAWSPSLDWFRRQKQIQKGRNDRPSFLAGAIQWLQGIFWPDKGKLWSYFASKKALAIHQKQPFDVVYSTSPLISAHIAALRFKKKTNVQWLCEFRDFFGVNNSVMDKNREKAEKLENKIIQNANRFLFVTTTMKNVFENRYPDIIHRTDMIYNGIDVEEIRDFFPQETLQFKAKKSIFYAGIFYEGLRDPMPLLQLFNQLLKNGKINYHDWEIVIAGSTETYLWHKLKGEPVNNIINCIGPTTKHVVWNSMAQSEFFWLIVPDIDSHRDTIPAKTFEYLYFGKPIIAFIPRDSEADQLLKSFPNIFIIYPDEKLEAAIEQMHDFLLKLPSSFDQVVFPFDRKLQVEEFDKILKEMVE